MDKFEALDALSALGQETRLDTFRLLVQIAPNGLPAGEIGDELGVVQNTMSAHLSVLTRAGLIVPRRKGRTVEYRANYERIRGLLSYLMQDCCQGTPEICAPLFELVNCLPNKEGVDPVVDRQFNVLFLCTGNSARSIMAEAILQREGTGRFNAYSAGSHPKGEVHPIAIDTLKLSNHRTEGFRSKDWEEFAAEGTPEMDFVFTVCDNAANEVCPVWPGQPMTAHWGVPDPATVEGTEAEKRLAFADSYRMLTNRISIFVNLPLSSLDKLALQKRLDAIGTNKADTRKDA